MFYRRYVLGESEEKARSRPLNPTLELYVRCYFETDWGRLRLAILRLRREIGRMLCEAIPTLNELQCRSST